MQTSKITIDHDEIRRWAEERGGRPAAVAGTGRGPGDPGILRIDFPEAEPDEKLVPISWDQWFKKFEKERLALLLQERRANGEISYFNKLVSRDEFLDKDVRTARQQARARTRDRASARQRATRTQATRASAHRPQSTRSTRATRSTRSAADGGKRRTASSSRASAASRQRKQSAATSRRAAS